MTIKQTGGIFGRNTDVKSAEIEDLTVTGSSTLSGAFSVQGTTGLLKQGADGNVLQIARGMNTDSAVVRIGGNRTGDGSTYIDMHGTSGATFGARLIRNAGTNGSTFLQTKGTGSLVVRTDDAGDVVVQTGGAEAARFNTSGNLAFPSGQGIDFSATAGTGTSELFDDYEEGSWSPVLSTGMSSGPSGYTTQRGSYTKVGNLVSAQLEMDVDGAVGSAALITLSGLPFTSSANSLAHGGGFFTYSNSFSTGSNVTIHIPASDTKIAFYRNNGNQVLGNDSDVSINNLVMITVVYVAA